MIKNKILKIKQYFSLKEKNKRKFAKLIKNMYNLFQVIEDSLPSRQAKKQFWLDFAKNGKIRKDVFDNIYNQYCKK